ncbi:Transcriptional regulator, AraC family [Labilithrix luteola]|uniref:Transcriptional regulator, AraC family n=2 Tax=Labilithrix luteola TaxID=1391654 RepID=A0A0K1PP77_9BACT|nr:Transcriptional regulator, AraC family [Labilithrix luteola]
MLWRMVLDSGTFRRLCLARDMLAEMGEVPLSIPDVAREIGISPFHFIRRFDALFGATPHQYRTQLRIDRAKELLACGQYSVTEVCMEVGFSSLGSFSDLFARRVGETPSAYRRRARSLVQVPTTMARALAPGCLSLMLHLPASAFRAFRNFREA